jgi:hypothetical protein
MGNTLYAWTRNGKKKGRRRRRRKRRRRRERERERIVTKSIA